MANLAVASVLLAALAGLSAVPAASAQAFAAAGAGAVASDIGTCLASDELPCTKLTTRRHAKRRKVMTAFAEKFNWKKPRCEDAARIMLPQAAAGLPFPVPAPVACAADVTRSPWGQPAMLFGAPAGLLTPAGSAYSDVTLCCGGTLDFSWTVHFFARKIENARIMTSPLLRHES